MVNKQDHFKRYLYLTFAFLFFYSLVISHPLYGQSENLLPNFDKDGNALPATMLEEGDELISPIKPLIESPPLFSILPDETDDFDGNGEIDDLEPLAEPLPQDTLSQEEATQNTPPVETSPSSNAPFATLIEEVELAPPSMASLGLLGPNNGGFPIDMWNGTGQMRANQLLRFMPRTQDSSLLSEVSRRLLVSQAIAPNVIALNVSDSTDESEKSENDLQNAFFTLRLQSLIALGYPDEAIGLLRQNLQSLNATNLNDTINENRDALPLSLSLLLGDMANAGHYDRLCDFMAGNDFAKMHLDQQSQEEHQIFCDLYQGNWLEAEIGLQIMQELGANNSDFISLANRLMENKLELNDNEEAFIASEHALINAMRNLLILRQSALENGIENGIENGAELPLPIRYSALHQDRVNVPLNVEDELELLITKAQDEEGVDSALYWPLRLVIENWQVEEETPKNQTGDDFSDENKENAKKDNIENDILLWQSALQQANLDTSLEDYESRIIMVLPALVAVDLPIDGLWKHLWDELYISDPLQANPKLYHLSEAALLEGRSGEAMILTLMISRGRPLNDLPPQDMLLITRAMLQNNQADLAKLFILKYLSPPA